MLSSHRHSEVIACTAMLLMLWIGDSIEAAKPALAPPAKKKIDFVADIKPILARHCLGCHGPKKAKSKLRLDQRASVLRGGESGEPALIPGKSAQSYLIKLVAGLDPDLVMPPKGKGANKDKLRRLNAAEIGLLRAWIDQGLPWPGQSNDDEPVELKTDHWSFAPVAKVRPPELGVSWAVQEIDAFVLARLKQAGLDPSQAADRVMMIRRLFLDMHGLPPTPKQVQQFVQDKRPDAYQLLVEQVLASPRYGERWAQHWLDVVRYADTNGFETNIERPNAYRYRDYVIKALNQDKPYDRFVFEQIAGDSVGHDEATGFLVAGPWDKVKSPDPVLTAMQRQDELADMINTTGATFLGMTIGCARCHHHKFDPIPQKDYYTMQAVFAGVKHGDRPMRPADFAQRQEQAKEIANQVNKIKSQLIAFAAQHRPDGQADVSIIIDDEQGPGAEVLAVKAGHGINPAGVERGFRDDLGDDSGNEERGPNISRGRYTWWQNKPNADLMVYRPNAVGRFRIWLSWGCGWNTHATKVPYLLDRDGDLKTRSDQKLIATIDQQLFARSVGKPVNKPLWSGLHDAGVHTLESASAIVIRSENSDRPVTADVIILQPVSADGPLPKATRPRAGLPINAKMNVERFAQVKAKFIRFTVTATNNGIEPCIDELEIWSQAKGDLPSKNVALTAGVKVTSSGNYKNNPKHKLEHINDGKYGNGRSWISNQKGKGWVQFEFPEPVLFERIVWGRDREQKYRDRVPVRYRIEAAEQADQWRIIARSENHLPMKAGKGKSKVNEWAFDFKNMPAQQAAKIKTLIAREKELEAKRKSLLTFPVAYAGQFQKPGPTHRLYRGDPMAKREKVGPEALTVLGPSLGGLNLSIDAQEQSRRVALANWMIRPDHPLTARVMVNRIWQQHFGRGIVATPSDFGGMGVKPTHPKLLDYLAMQLIENGWSIKHMHRLILLSNTYRQSSVPNAKGVAVDRDARWLWRFPPRRLEAEAIRDSILAVSGALDLSMGGPGFRFFKPNSNYVRVYEPKDTYGAAEFRRMVYALKVRMEKDDVFGSFDCPDAGQPTPNRSRSTTAIQSLGLFNSGFVLQQADLFAKRIQKQAGPDIDKQVTSAFELAVGRTPNPRELQASATLVKQHGLPAFCRVVLNMNEFLFMP